MQKLAMELVGTMFLVLAIGMTGNPIAIGIVLAVMIYCGGHVSGAHYNPAVSFALFLRKKIDAVEMIKYWVAQLAGGTAGAFLVGLFGVEGFLPAPGVDVSFGIAVLAEVLGTFALVLVILNVATSKALDGNKVYGFAIGLTVTGVAFALGGISGGAFNPAVGTGPAVAATNFAMVHLYWIGPLVGGALAALFYGFLGIEDA